MYDHGRACLASFHMSALNNIVITPMPISVKILLPNAKDNSPNFTDLHFDRSLFAILNPLENTWKVDIRCPTSQQFSSYIHSEWIKTEIKGQMICNPVFEVCRKSTNILWYT